MLKRTQLFLLSLLTIVPISGCWDYREVHQVAYVVTIGVDYANDKYTLYAQVLNFANIAQQEGVRPPKHKAVIGIATGNTLTDAMFNLYRSEQQYIYWGHIKAVIFSRRTLEQVKFASLVDSISRFRELRYNVWAFGTDEPIDKLMSLNPTFGYSPFDSRLVKHIPPVVEHQADLSESIRLRIFHPGTTGAIAQTWRRPCLLDGRKQEDAHVDDGRFVRLLRRQVPRETQFRSGQRSTIHGPQDGTHADCR